MPEDNSDLGNEVVENEDGTLSAADPIEKMEYVMPAGAKGKAEAALSALLNKIKGAKDGEMSPELAKECKAAAAMLSGLGGGFPAPKEGAKPKDKDEEAGMAKSEPAVKEVDAVELDGMLFTGPLAELAKRGAKMSAEKRKKLKDLLKGMQSLYDELDPASADARRVEAMLNQGISGIAKRMDDLETAIKAMAPAPADDPDEVPDGQAGDAEQTPVAKAAPGHESWIRRDLNDPNMFVETADKEITFFED